MSVDSCGAAVVGMGSGATLDRPQERRERAGFFGLFVCVAKIQIFALTQRDSYCKKHFPYKMAKKTPVWRHLMHVSWPNACVPGDRRY